MRFEPFIISNQTNEKVIVRMIPASSDMLRQTMEPPVWQTDWTSDYLSDPKIQKYAVLAEYDELVALGAYFPVQNGAVYVYIVYIESSPENNPVLTHSKDRKYSGIGELMMAFGIKLPIDLGGNGDILFEAKTDALKEHYIRDFGAIPVGTVQSGGPVRLLICDESAARIFTKYLSE
ncbi:MAG: hypothetical protein HDT26_03945 [Subdoligranulum sp.]|nr:hypothetical protein [Subdoligranulum sp.]